MGYLWTLIIVCWVHFGGVVVGVFDVGEGCFTNDTTSDPEGEERSPNLERSLCHARCVATCTDISVSHLNEINRILKMFRI